jgi:hypothetical protein
MKAVLLNSADKIKDTGDGLYLGMTRTVVGKDNRNWLDSDAYKTQKFPWTFRWVRGNLMPSEPTSNLNPGEWKPWLLYHRWVGLSNCGASSFKDYVLEQPLKKGSFVSLTLTGIA